MWHDTSLPVSSFRQVQLTPPQYYAHPSVTRYFNNLQHRPPIRAVADFLSPPFQLVDLDIENAPKIDRKQEAPKKKAPKAPKEEAAAETPSQNDAPAAAAAAKKDKKDKKAAVLPEETVAKVAPPAEASKKPPKAASAPPPADGSSKKAGKGGAIPADSDDGVPVPSMIDLRVGHIVSGQSLP